MQYTPFDLSVTAEHVFERAPVQDLSRVGLLDPSKINAVPVHQPQIKTKKNEAEKPGISVFGLGYVGTVSTACFCSLGFNVIGVDIDKSKVSSMRRGIASFYEPNLSELLVHGVGAGELSATTDVAYAVHETDVSMVTVGTPSRKDGSCNIDSLKMVCGEIGLALRNKETYHLVIFRSTVPPKTTRDTLIPLLELSSGKLCGRDFGVCFNPEFMREGTAVNDFHKPPKTVIGAYDKKSADIATKLYEEISGELVVSSIEAAEFVKYVNNAWHALKVVFANEIGRLCKGMHVDSHEVMDIFIKDKKLNLSACYLTPGFAFGGSCLPKDTRGICALAKEYSVDMPMLKELNTSNQAHIDHAVKLVRSLAPRKVGILGVTFKAGTDDLRESPLLRLAERLGKEVPVIVYDPNLDAARLVKYFRGKDVNVSFSSTPDAVADESDVLVIGHELGGIYDISEKSLSGKHVVDLVRTDTLKFPNAQVHGICW